MICEVSWLRVHTHCIRDPNCVLLIKNSLLIEDTIQNVDFTLFFSVWHNDIDIVKEIKSSTNRGTTLIIYIRIVLRYNGNKV